MDYAPRGATIVQSAALGAASEVAMRLRHRADLRTLLYAFVLMPGLPVLQYAAPSLLGWLLPAQLYLGFLGGVIAHNHNHSPTFDNRRTNAWFSAWMSIWYGVPIFGWIPTHNQNHHKFLNGPGDTTITWRYFRRNSALSLLSYFFVSNRFQGPSIRAYVQHARREHPALLREIALQIATLLSAHALMLGAALARSGLRAGLMLYGVAFLAQSLYAWWAMYFINFVQHVDCDPSSRYDHSRNFVGKLGNWLTFNAGYHTAHHERAGLHWSKLPELHRELAPHIDPRLNEPSLLWFTFRTYLLAPLLPRLNTRLIGPAPWEVI
jgi:fatty acid desaturase